MGSATAPQPRVLLKPQRKFSVKSMDLCPPRPSKRVEMVIQLKSLKSAKKVRFHSRESLGFERLELPEQSVETVATWIAPAQSVLADGRDLGSALIGIANVLVEVVPVFLMCDTSDIGAAVDTTQKGGTGLFLYDRFPGGMGYARGALSRLPEILAAAEKVIRDCPCETGCPACVGSAVPNVASNDLDTSVRGRIPDKRAAAELIGVLTGDRAESVEAGTRPIPEDYNRKVTMT